MKRLILLLFATLFTLSTVPLLAEGGGDEKAKSEAEPERRSVDPNPEPKDNNPVSYPGGPFAKAPLATGYYVTDNDGPNSGAPWQPAYEFIDTTVNPTAWRRLVSGPNQGNTVTRFGYEYFRNPNKMEDSTNDAFAGPITIGFPFYYYGIRYDSFYVSTNGLVGLSNRRYIYDLQGRRIAYDTNRDDPRPVHSGGFAVDTMADDYGYRYVALNNDTVSPIAGLLNPNNTPFPNNRLYSVLAPLWDDQELSQIDPESGIPDDFGRVYWRLDNTGSKLIIYFVNMSMAGRKYIPPVFDQPRPVPPRRLRANVQVVLNSRDSSVQFNYRQFAGSIQDPIQGIFQIPSATMYRSNGTIGIQSHDREYTNYLANVNTPEGGTVYVNGDPLATPRVSLAIQFKQWKNVVRVIEVSYQTPNPDTPTIFRSLSERQLADNFELLLGHPILGALRPVGIVQSVSSDVGPVNVTPQPIRFNVIFRIRDLVCKTCPPVYQKTRTTLPLNYLGMDTVIFDPYVTNPNLEKQLGRFRAEIIATDRSPTGFIYGDRWPFDDTTGTLLFGIRRVELPYVTTFNNYSVAEDGVVPDVKSWVSIGVEVVDGDAETYNPPPPRGTFGARNLSSPVAKIDRRNLNGGFYANDATPPPLPRSQGATAFVFSGTFNPATDPADYGLLVGDTLISFPINLSTAQGQPVLLLSYQRAGRQGDPYPRGWSDAIRVGPEQAVYTTQKTLLHQTPDQLLVEFAEPSSDTARRINNITNAKRWREPGFLKTQGSINALAFYTNAGRYHVVNKPDTASPRWAIFGGGGYIDTSGAFVIDEFDGGKDFVYKRTIVPIPRRWTSNLDVAKYFRFRLRGLLHSHKNSIGGPPADDNDAFYVDNIIVADPDKPEVEATAVVVDWPYTEAPASQARAIPLSAKVSNNGTTAATAFGVAMYVENQTTPPPPGYFNYYRYQTVVALLAGEDMIVPFPTWNAQECGQQIIVDSNTTSTLTKYRVYAEIQQGYDSYNANDKTWTDFNLRLGSTFAYDFIDERSGQPRNDVSGVAGIPGKGLNLVAPYPDAAGAQPYGPVGGSNSGTFAMQFRILTRDTIKGFQAWYGAANSSPDYVLYSIYRQQPTAAVTARPSKLQGNPTYGLRLETRRYALRGQGRPADPTSIPSGPFNFDEYVIYDLDTPYVADPGIYFVTVGQLGQTGLELGASTYRQGQVITVLDITGGGAGNVNVPLNPEMRDGLFWYELTSESESWNPMLSTFGNPGYPHLNIAGQVPPSNWPTFQRASWVPMIRPYFGFKEAGTCAVLPVELSKFEATALTSAIRLDWQTATEINNRGFGIERRLRGEDNWAEMSFVEGLGTSNQAHDYAFLDKDVTTGVTYQYRLRQEDFDGSTSYSAVREARLNGATTGAVASELKQNSPNPASSFTQIPFTVSESGLVSIEITDIYGKVVRTITADVKGGVESMIDWDLKTDDGREVANGTYIYKLTAKGFTASKKMTVVR